MPGNIMSKEEDDAPSRSASSLTFTIDNILNLKQRESGDLSKGQRRDSKEDLHGVWDVRRRHGSGAEQTGNWEFNTYMINQ